MNVGIFDGPVDSGTSADHGRRLSIPVRSEAACGNDYRLWQRVARECEAMAEHAFATGRTIPVEVAVRFEEAMASLRRTMQAAESSARQDGQDAPPSAAALLTSLHATLATIIQPATPEAVSLLLQERCRRSRWYAFGPLPIVRHMLGMAAASLVLLLGVSLSREINPDNMGRGLLNLFGYPLLMVEIFLLSAASLGSCFQNLQQINAFISAGNYDPKFQSTYWTRWVMGLISGIVLSQLVYEFLPDSQSRNGAIPAVVGEPALALLGGYAVDLVHGVLSHVVNAIGSFFRAPTVAASNGQGSGQAEDIAARIGTILGSELAELRASLAAGVTAEAVMQRLDEMIQSRSPRRDEPQP